MGKIPDRLDVLESCSDRGSTHSLRIIHAGKAALLEDSIGHINQKFYDTIVL
jgi:hypothetical protein